MIKYYKHLKSWIKRLLGLNHNYTISHLEYTIEVYCVDSRFKLWVIECNAIGIGVMSHERNIDANIEYIKTRVEMYDEGVEA